MRFFLNLLIVIFVVVAYEVWFLHGLIAGGDFYFTNNLISKTIYPFIYIWTSSGNFGIGGSLGPLIPSLMVYFWPIYIFTDLLHINWQITERIIYLYPFLILTFFSSYFLFKKLFDNKKFAFLSSFMFSTNTYILMLVGGGQIILGLAYGIIPFILLYAIDILNNSKFNLKHSFIFGLLISIQIFLDLRITYITLSAVGLYWLIALLSNKNLNYLLKSLIFVLIIPGIVSALLHAFWLLPTILLHENPLQQLGSAYTTTGAVQYFSFANFENTLSLLHPNWPENIFGKVGFMKPEFIILPILAFTSLFFIKKLKSSNERTYVLFFALLGLIGAFLAKGANDPFGGIYLFLFNYFPGFFMFRDPTKWYTLVAISYSILIPFSVWNIYMLLSSKFKAQRSKWGQIFNFQNLFILLLTSYLLLLIRPALLGQLTGTFKTTSVPSDYIKLENFLYKQNSFSRTLWVPTTQRFGYLTNNHPGIPAETFFNLYNDKNLIQKIASSESLLQNSGVKYVIVPYDSQGEIFLSDRRYSNSLYVQTIKDVGSISWLKPVSGFGKIAVFEVPDPKGHFYIIGQGTIRNNQDVSDQYISPVEYTVDVKNVKKGDVLVFAESYDSGWEASSTKFKVLSSKFDNRFNSFVLPDSGTYSLDVYYTPQDLVNEGVVISLVSLMAVLGYLLWSFKIKK